MGERFGRIFSDFIHKTITFDYIHYQEEFQRPVLETINVSINIFEHLVFAWNFQYFPCSVVTMGMTAF